mmetsp:Transcript_4061/g.6781  ORF Transcript_4061/g.6781 Transcript_4061/m.6781 type:complete len:115 (-) Transcript_4061:481-825(-)
MENPTTSDLFGRLKFNAMHSTERCPASAVDPPPRKRVLHITSSDAINFHLNTHTTTASLVLLFLGLKKTSESSESASEPAEPRQRTGDLHGKQHGWVDLFDVAICVHCGCVSDS